MHIDVTIEKGRHHSVTIRTDMPHMDLCISAEQALDILRALKAHETEIVDMAHNYYDCGECGQTHPKNIRSCAANTESVENEEEDDEF